MSIRTSAHRAAALLAGGALVASGLGLAGPAPAAHAADTPAPEATATATWLDGQLVDGLLSGDVSRTMDFGLSLLASGTDTPELLTTINAGIDANINTYVTNNGTNAKAAYYYQIAGGDPTKAAAFVNEVEADVNDSGQIDGGMVYSQVWAVLALQLAGSGETQAAGDALIATQCTTGADIGSWGYSCDGGADYDYTAYSILALLPFDEDPTASAAIDAAIAWLKSETAADGGIGETMWTPNNTNSTGLLAWALGEAGDPAAAKSAAWVARHQLVKLTGCTSALDPEAGAIGYDATAISNARADGEIAAPDRSQWTLASAQALAGLGYLSAPAVGKVTAPTGYVQAGTNVTVKVSGLRAGQPGCLAGFGNAKPIAGPLTTTVKLPATTGNRVLALRWINGSTTTTIKALGTKTFSPRVTSARVRRGGLQTVLVSGLAPGERFSVRYAGRVVRTGTATSAGGVRASFRVGQSTGIKGVVVLGQFSNRRGSTAFRVVR